MGGVSNMPVMDLIEQFTTDFINIRAVIIALIMVGLITSMTAMTYILEQRAFKLRRPKFTHLIHGIEAASVIVSIILLRQVFWVMNSGDVLSWGYATAQLTVLLFSLYMMQNLAVELVNIVMPIFFYGQGMYMGRGWQYVAVFITMSLLLTGSIIYVSHHQASALDATWKYLALQIVYGGTWCFIIWSVHPFDMWYTLTVLVVFTIYMAVIRFFVTRVSNFVDRFTRLDQAVNYDELTGIRNRASFDTASVDVFSFYEKHPNVPITMVMFDIDHFKRFNDQYGHMTGDAVLKHVAQHFQHELAKQTSRGEVFRYGGEEFVIIFRGVDAQKARQIVTTIRNSLQAEPLVYNDQALTITVSLGISALKAQDSDFDSWFKRVDHYLYQSKEAGRNRLTIEGATMALK